MEALVLIATLIGSNLAPVSLPSVSYDEVKCLSDAIYFESVNEPFMGKLYVAQVITNRTDDTTKLWPNDVCSVIKQPSRNPKRPKACQFSFTCNKTKTKKTNVAELLQADIAAFVILTRRYVYTESLHYTRCDVRRSWMSDMTLDAKIGEHCFYK